MTPAKEPQDRRQDKEARMRFAIRKANDRMFAALEKRPEPQAKPEGRERH
jgi:hypothetical protein